MKNPKIYVVPKRRKREQKTNYKKRLALLKSKLPRLVVRLSNMNVIAQVVRYGEKGDAVLASVHSRNIKKNGWDGSGKSVPAAYLVGYSLGKKLASENIGDVIFDSGLISPDKGSRYYACVKGAFDGGLKIKVDDSMFPSEERISGAHIGDAVSKKVEEIKSKL